MNKKITGVPESKDQARLELVDSRYRFTVYREHLKEKKNEYQHMKKEHDMEREEIKREEK